MVSVHSGLHLFRYYDEADYADGYVMSADFNYWAWTYKATKATQFSVSSILALTQALQMLGLLNTQINLMAWMYLSMAGMIVSFLLHLNRNFWIKNQAWQISQDSSYSQAEQTQATNLYTGIKADDLRELAQEVSTFFALWSQHKNWELAQVMTLPEEKRKHYINEKYGGRHSEESHLQTLSNLALFDI